MVRRVGETTGGGFALGGIDVRLLLVGLAVLAASSSLSAEAGSSSGQKAYCHQDWCEWFRVDRQGRVAGNAQGTLFKVSARWWVSHHPDAVYDRRQPPQQPWSSVTYVFCSRERPAVIVPSDSQWSAMLVSVRGPSGARRALTSLYWYVCHRTIPGDAVSERLANRFGYDPDGRESDTILLKRPEDVLTMVVPD
jgi:hypothetical protein